MSNNIIQYAFIAGEVSPKLFARTDLEKYDLGVAEAYNFFVDYRGGLSSRPGSVFVDYIKDDDKATKMFEFSFAPDDANTYVVLFGDEYVRFLQDGAYVLESPVGISAITQADPGVVTTGSAHGYSTDDWVKIAGGQMPALNGRSLHVTVLSSTTFSLQDVFGNDIDTSGFPAYTSGGTVSRVYTLTSPYTAANLSALRAHQWRNTLRLTHPNRRPRILTRNDHDDWAFEVMQFRNSHTRPTGLVLDSTNPNTGTYLGVVTAVDNEGRESLPSVRVLSEVFDNSGYEDGSVRVIWTWDLVADTDHYLLYKSNKETESLISGGEQLGYLAKTYGNYYSDSNSVPDFTRTPPRDYDPFAIGAVRYVNVTAVGSGYAVGDTVSVSGGGGSGFIGELIVNPDDGSIAGVLVVSGGRGYSSPTVSFNTSAGSGATATAELSAAVGVNPLVSTIFQQRQVFASTLNDPLTIWGSKIQDFENFSISDTVTEDDAYEFTLDLRDVAPIKHIVPTRGGLLTFTQVGIWLVTGGLEQSISSINALAEPQTYTGCADIPPLEIETDILYAESRGSTVRLLSYNDFSKVYGGTNVSILANHLFPDDKELIQWSFASAPHKIVWACRSDGTMLMFTFVKDQEVYAWTQCQTRGLFRDVLSVQSGNLDTVYTVVERYINGRWSKFIETFDSRIFSDVENAWCVDAGLALGHTYPAAALTVAASDGDGVTCTASASVFSSGDVGKVLRVGGGKGIVSAYNSATEIEIDISRPITSVLPFAGTPLVADSGTWTLDAPVSEISGLWHLEGETVAILADGNVVEDLVVTDGGLTLPFDATRVIIGLPYTCRVQTLPPTVQNAIIEHRVKNILGASVRMADTRGLEVGSALDNLYPMKERTNEAWGEPTRLQNDVKTVLIEANWDINGQTWFVQRYPLPATILGLVFDLEVGDDND